MATAMYARYTHRQRFRSKAVHCAVLAKHRLAACFVTGRSAQSDARSAANPFSGAPRPATPESEAESDGEAQVAAKPTPG